MTDHQLQRRALTGVAPDGHVKVKSNGQVILPPLSSAFHSDELLVAADQTVRNSAAFQRKVTELLPGETFITVKAGDIGDLGLDLGRGYKRLSSSRYRPELQGPPVKVENLRSVQATYELNPQTNVWETVTIFPAEL